MNLFINLSNHSSEKWSNEQIDATNGAKIIDIRFPNINPHWDEKELNDCVQFFFHEIEDTCKENNISTATVHLMGETGFVCRLGRLLFSKFFTVVHSTTERIVEEKDGVKQSIFQFVRFRKSF